MGAARPLRSPEPIDSHALDQLKFIRSTMERASSFTAVPGAGGVVMGATALVAARIASHQSAPDAWFRVWMAELALAMVIGVLSVAWKAGWRKTVLLSGPARKFASGFAPAILAGGLLTWPLHHAGMDGLLAAVWLLLYGVAFISAGTFSVRAVPLMGAAFFTLGVFALGVPSAWRDLVLGCGFGGLHVVFGLWIWRRYGG